MGRDDEHSIFNEPHLHGRGQVDPSEARVDAAAAKRRARAADAESIYDEPDILPGRAPERIEGDWTCSGCGYNLRGLMTGQACPECGHIELYRPAPSEAPGYARWLRERIAATSTARTWRVTFLLLLLGGPWAVIAAMMGAEPAGIAGIPLTLVVLFGPATEEVMKLGATLVVAETRPYLFKRREQLQIAVIGSALAFAVIENLLYLRIYIPNPSTMVVLWRWTVCVALHVGCTLIASRGLIATWETTIREGRPPQLARAFPMLITAIIVHGAYNFSMVVLQMAGYLR